MFYPRGKTGGQMVGGGGGQLKSLDTFRVTMTTHNTIRLELKKLNHVNVPQKIFQIRVKRRYNWLLNMKIKTFAIAISLYTW